MIIAAAMIVVVVVVIVRVDVTTDSMPPYLPR